MVSYTLNVQLIQEDLHLISGGAVPDSNLKCKRTKYPEADFECDF